MTLTNGLLNLSLACEESKLSPGLLKVVVRLTEPSQVNSLSDLTESSFRLPSTQERSELLGNNSYTLKDMWVPSYTGWR